MSSKDLAHWVQDWGPLVTLISAVLLALVTAWLAWVTTRIAKGAKDAAKYSEIAAKSSFESAAAIRASAPVEFTLGISRVTKTDKMLGVLNDMISENAARAREQTDIRWFNSTWVIDGLELRCDGSAVYIHGGRIVEIYREVARHDIECEATRVVLVDSVALPRRLHKGEILRFGVDCFQPGEQVVGMTIIIDYSFDGQNTVHQRLVAWHAEPEKYATVKATVLHSSLKPRR